MMSLVPLYYFVPSTTLCHVSCAFVSWMMDLKVRCYHVPLWKHAKQPTPPSPLHLNRHSSVILMSWRGVTRLVCNMVIGCQNLRNLFCAWLSSVGSIEPYFIKVSFFDVDSNGKFSFWIVPYVCKFSLSWVYLFVFENNMQICQFPKLFEKPLLKQSNILDILLSNIGHSGQNGLDPFGAYSAPLLLLPLLQLPR